MPILAQSGFCSTEVSQFGSESPHRKEGVCVVIKGCTFGKRLRILRRHRGLTQRELGLQLGFSSPSAEIRITQYERSQRYPKQAVIEQFAKVLRVDPAALLSYAAGNEDDLLQSLFWTEEIAGIEAVEACLKYWRQLRELRDSGVLSPEEYLELKVTKPHSVLQ